MQQTGAERLEPSACFDLMLAGFDRAQQCGTPVEHCYRFGEHGARFIFAGDALVDALAPALAHLRIDDGPADLTVHLWDTESSAEPLSPLVAFLTDRIASDPYRWLSARHEITGISNARVPATFDQWSGALSVYDRASARAVYWIPDAARVPYFERGAPLRTLLSWWLADIGYQSVHAAAVGRADAGVLLAGKGGSGKSSTALRCLDAGMRYLGDDYCMFSVGAAPQAFSLYNTGKLNGADDLARLPRFAPMVENPDAPADEKLLMFLQSHFPEQMALSFPIAALLVPRVTDAPVTTVTEISPGAALTALAPTTLLQRPGAAGAALSAMGALVRSVRCYALALGAQGADAPEVIANLLDAHTS